MSNGRSALQPDAHCEEFWDCFEAGHPWLSAITAVGGNGLWADSVGSRTVLYRGGHRLVGARSGQGQQPSGGVVLRTLGRQLPQQLPERCGVAVSPSGNLIVTDTVKRRAVTVRSALPRCKTWLPLVVRSDGACLPGYLPHPGTSRQTAIFAQAKTVLARAR